MPYLLMSKCYEYDDESYHEEGGYPELVFADEQEGLARATLESYPVRGCLGCTPLYYYYANEFLDDLSSTDLDEDEIAEAVSTIVGQTLTAEDIYHLDFEALHLTHPQLEQLAKLLD
jgi:hypothetical protein